MVQIFGCLMALVLPLSLWTILYPITDWAALALAPLLIMIFAGCYLVNIQRRQADVSVMIESHSWLNRWMRGRISATFTSCILSVTTVSILSFKSLSADYVEIVLIGLISICSFASFAYFQNNLSHDVRPRYLPTLSTRFGYLAVGILFFPIYTYMSWAFIKIPGYLVSYSFSEAMLEGIKAVPEREGVITEIMAAMYTLENAKLWVVVNFANNAFIFLIYAAYGATLSFILARGTIAIAALYRLSSK